MEKKNTVNGFTFFNNYYEALKNLNDEQRIKFYDAICKYMFEDEEIEFEGIEQALWKTLKLPLDKSKSKSGNSKSEEDKSNEKETKNIKQNQIKSKNNKSNQKKSNEIKSNQNENVTFLEKKKEEVEEEKEIEDEVLKKENVKEKKHTPPKKYFGLFKNVLLTEQEHKNLFIDYGDTKAVDYIERLSGYIESTGKRYKSHYATIQNWARKDGVERWSKLNNIDLAY